MTYENQDYPIRTSALGRRFGWKEAVRDLDLQVPQGTVFALIGPNGAGKTTTIKVLMNILPPSEGRSWVLGRNSTKLSPSEFQRIGYVSENQELPEWMTVGELLAYCRPLYPAWDQSFSERLLDEFNLPRDKKIGALSRGIRMQAALVSSLAYRPPLLILDEPFSGLDPVVREDLTHGVLELTGDTKQTIFLSSQDIEEVERLADGVAFIDDGNLFFSESVASLQSRFRRIEVVLSDEPPAPTVLPTSWIRPEVSGRTIRFIDGGFSDGTEAEVKNRFPGCREIRIEPVSLRRIFITLARSHRATVQGGSA